MLAQLGRREPAHGGARRGAAAAAPRRRRRARATPTSAPRCGSAARCATRRARRDAAQRGARRARRRRPRRPRAARRAAADPRVGRGRDRRRGAADDDAGRARRARRSTSRRAPLRRHDLEHRARLQRCSPTGASTRPRRCSSPPARPASAPAAPDLAYGGWANAACIASRRRPRTSARSSYADRGAASAARHPDARVPDGGPASRTRSPGSGATTRRAPRATARPSSPSGSRRRELALLADHDDGPAGAAGGRPRARRASCSAARSRATRRCSAAEARLRRAEALARLGRADEADAEIRAAALEPIARRAPPGGARRADGVRAGARARGRAATHALAERRLREAEAPVAAARRRRTTRRASTSPRSSTSGARRSPASSTRPPSSSAWPRSSRDWRPMPTFDDSTTTAGAGRGGLEAALRPGAHGRVVGGRSSASSRGHDGEGDITIYPDGYPDFPMPQELRTDADGRGLTISCLVSDLVFEWRLEPLGRRDAHRACTSRSPRRRRTGSRRSARE